MGWCPHAWVSLWMVSQAYKWTGCCITEWARNCKEYKTLRTFSMTTLNMKIEELLTEALNKGQRLYSTKCIKDIKFVVHTSTLIKDYLKNFPFYFSTMQYLQSGRSRCKPATVTEAQGHLRKMTDSAFKPTLFGIPYLLISEKPLIFRNLDSKYISTTGT